MEISKVVIPAAGRGSRFSPYTNTVPKEMLPILNKPAIHYSVQEALTSGFEEVLFITNRHKELIAHYVDSEEFSQGHFSYIRQSEPLGLGHAVLMAKPFIGKEHFGIALPDDIIMHKTPALAQLARIARQERASVIAVQEVPHDQISAYGVIKIKKQLTPNLFHIDSVVEKPSLKDAPSNLAIIGRYILSSKIFTSLHEISSYATSELQLTDAIAHMIQTNEKVFAYKVEGTRYDIGTPRGWLKTMVDLGLQDPHYKDDIIQLVNAHTHLFYGAEREL